MTSVFCSYSAKDIKIANRLANELRNSGIDVWESASLRSGAKWVEEIEQAIKKLTFLLLFFQKTAQSQNGS